MPGLCDSTHFVEVFEVKNKPTVRFTPARLCRVPDFGCLKGLIVKSSFVTKTD